MEQRLFLDIYNKAERWVITNIEANIELAYKD